MYRDNFNVDNEKITIEEIRKFEGFENLSDDEAEKLSNVVYDITLLAYDFEFLNKRTDL